MSFRVYNTYSRTKEAFVPLEEGVVRMYNCGPTVYKRQHIGNFRAFLFADVLRRWLEYLGFEVRQVMNITDVGHLLDAGADEGEDRLEAQAKKTGLDPWEISRRETEQFFADLERIGIRKAMVYPRATAHVPEMLEIIEGLLARGNAYEVGESVYFDVSSFERYGQLSGNTVEDLEAGARVGVLEEKRAPEDFALWKSDPKHRMKWSSRFGEHGFPGWHIECSAMARCHLGDRIDIHTGGEDNIFPHHECEIAQSEAFTGETFSRYWMHARYLLVDGGKMSKSLGNVYTVDDVVERGFDLRVYRYAVIRGHYRQPINFTWDIMEEARTALAGLDDMVGRLRSVASGADGERGLECVEAAVAEFESGMNDDLNTPRALAALFGLRHHVTSGALGSEAAARALGFLQRANDVLGVIQLEVDVDQLGDDAIRARIDERKRAKQGRNWSEADRIRDELAAAGVVLEDAPDGTTRFHRS